MNFQELRSYVQYNGHALMYESTFERIIYDNLTKGINSINQPENYERLT